MAIRAFNVGPVKGLQHAGLTDVPNLLVIVGPNGSGKSTLLYELWRQRAELAEPRTRVSYLGPNRPWRRTNLNAAVLHSLPLSFRQLTEQESAPVFQFMPPSGYQQSGQPRSADSVDDAQGLVKFSIIKLELKRRDFIAKVFDASGGNVPPGIVPDIFGPLSRLVSVLLPHLRFVGVDSDDQMNQRCLFEKLDLPTSVQIDIDDLSSGEKAIIALFLPFVESQIERLLTISTGATGASEPKPVAIIDEPELHLHPVLQTALLAYVRELARQDEAQFIIATHSTTLMDGLEEDELYLLAPPATVGEENQLSKLTTTHERLELVRELTGSTYVVTRCRPIVFLEGEQPATKGVSDQRIIEMLIPESTGWVMVPSRGRSQAIEAAARLRDPTLTELPGLPVFALVDRDQVTSTEADHVIAWPVCMVENLLLDPVAIWSLLEPQREQIRVRSADEVAMILDRYCAERRDEEVRLRTRRRIAQPRLKLAVQRPGDADSLEKRVQAEASKYVSSMNGEIGLKAAVDAVEEEVSAILAAGEQLERFHGKELLKRFFHEHAQQEGWSYATFAYQLAQKVAGTSRLARLVGPPVRQIRQFVPAALSSALQEACTALAGAPEQAAAEAARDAVISARSAWETDAHDNHDRGELRTQVLRVSRDLKQAGRVDLQERLLSGLTQLGTT